MYTNAENLPEDPEPEQGSGRHRVLVVDDEALIRWSVAERLRDDGWFVRTVADLATARQRLDAERWDLLISDVKLPDGDGTELLDEMAAAEQKVPILMITAHGDDRLRAKAVAAGAVDVIDKPFEMDVLAARAKNIVTGQP
jgi:DNA-binding response OmpR family regulator